MEQDERHLVFPERVEIQLLDPEKHRYRVENVILGVHTFARFRNDYYLGPFFSNTDGLVTITKEALRAGVEQSIAYALMDYMDVDTCFPLIEIYFMQQKNIDFVIERLQAGRITRWELELWNSAEELIMRYSNSGNKDLRIPSKGFRDEWDGSQDKYNYNFIVTPKAWEFSNRQT